MRRFRLFAILIALICTSSHAMADDVPRQSDRAAIEQVVQQFQSAILAKDGKALAGLFLQDHSSWLSVLDETTYQAVKARNPAASRFIPSTWQEFVKFVASSPKPVEERFSNVRIDTNGAVGSVYFDFVFTIDGAVTNRGSESWQMVHTENGWKISSMLYSVGR
jgi:hypothetical protein